MCLQTSKTLNYIDHPLTEPYFILFLGVWVYTRHYLNLRLIYSIFTEFRTVGPYHSGWDIPDFGQYKCKLALVISSSLLSSLQALNLFWLFLIVRIAYRFLTNHGLADDRSDGEESDAETPAPTPTEKKRASLQNGTANGNGSASARGSKSKANGVANGSAH